jgi:hypothetical protein
MLGAAAGIVVYRRAMWRRHVEVVDVTDWLDQVEQWLRGRLEEARRRG